MLEINITDDFSEKMRKLRAKEMDGFNVTVPYKQKIIPYLDEIDEEAEKMGAVNTVVKENDRWIGYNTDGRGYLRALKSKFPAQLEDRTKRILILGAGGAARGIYYALVHDGYTQIDIANRTKESALDIAKLQDEQTETHVLTLDKAEQLTNQYDIFIQTTSVGMGQGNEDMIISLDGVKKSAIVSDIVYQPIETAFLKKAKSLGASVHYGHTMLLYQAQYAFEIWTNKHVPMNQMDEELQEILKG